MSLGRKVLSDDEWSLFKSRSPLSNREIEVVCGVFDDMGESRIAIDLAISRHTVNTHIRRIYRKLGVRTRVQLVISVMSLVKNS